MIYIIFVLGLLLGSFFLLVGLRLPREEDIIVKRSYCDQCKNNLKWYHLIPFFSYVFLRGKCEYCKAKINPLNIIVELSTAGIFAYLFYLYGFEYEFFAGVIISSIFILICITDFKGLIILDSPLIIGGALLIICQFIYLDMSIVLFNLGSAIIMFLFMLGVKLVGDKIYKRDSMGGGDIKFSFIIGLSIGIPLSFFVLVLSAFLALPTSVAAVLQTKNKEVPYGPFLAGSLLLVFLNSSKFYDLINLFTI